MIRFGAVLFSGLLAASLASAAPLQIDDFSLNQAAIQSTHDNPVSHTVVNDGSFIGGPDSTRTISTISDGEGVPGSQVSSIEIGGGVLEYGSGVGVIGEGRFAYDNLDGVDLSSYVGFMFHDLSTDHAFDYDITITDTDGAVSILAGEFSLPTPANNVNTFLSFADFVGLADLASVASLQFDLGSVNGTDISALDFSLSGISAVTAIPVPPAGLFLVSALVGLGILRRRRD